MTSPLQEARPRPARWAGAGVAALVVAGLGAVGGISPERSALLAAAAAVAVLTVRVAGDDLTWPQPPARRTRPGWHGVASTLRQLEGARTDAGDRSTLRVRLARLEHDGPHPAATAVRAALPGASRRPGTSAPGTSAPGPSSPRPPSPWSQS